MKAIIRTGYVSSTLGFSETHPVPEFDPNVTNADEVLISVKAASINPIDYKLNPMAKLAFDIVGFDVSGVIEKVGSKASSTWKVGDTVFGQASRGSLAEHVIAPANRIAKKPDSLSFIESAALPVAYVVGYLGLVEHSGVTPESEVLIIGASGGCGIAALQLARALKVKRIVGICSGKNADFAKEHGATEVVDYTKKEELKNFFAENKGKFVCVYDASTGSGAGENYLSAAEPTMSSDGKYIQLNGKLTDWGRKFTNTLPKNRIMPLVSHSMKTEQLTEVGKLLEESDAKPIVVIQPFNETGFKDGFKMLKSRRTKGKIVYDIAGESN